MSARRSVRLVTTPEGQPMVEIPLAAGDTLWLRPHRALAWARGTLSTPRLRSVLLLPPMSLAQGTAMAHAIKHVMTQERTRPITEETPP